MRLSFTLLGLGVLATLIGIVPGTFVYASVGAGLGSVFARGGTFSAAGVLTPQVVTALVGLALLALVPVAHKRLKARRSARAGLGANGR